MTTVKELRIILEGLLYTIKCMSHDVIAGFRCRNYVLDFAVAWSGHAGPMHVFYIAFLLIKQRIIFSIDIWGSSVTKICNNTTNFASVQTTILDSQSCDFSFKRTQLDDLYNKM